MPVFGRTLCVMISLIALCAASSPATAKSIKMLPPVQSNNPDVACSLNEGNKLLTWDGDNSISCNANVRVDASGQVVLGTVAPTNLVIRGLVAISRDGVGECCSSGDTTLSLAENTVSTGKLASIQFHNGGSSEAYIRLAHGGQRRLLIGDNQGTGAGLQMSGPLYVNSIAAIDHGSVGECCSNGNYTLSLAENTAATGKPTSIQFHNGGSSEAYIRLAHGGQRRFIVGDNQGETAGLQMSGPLYVDGTGVSYIAGSVGVGTSTPGAKLDVAGTVRSVTKSNLYTVDFAYLTAKHDWCHTSAFAQGTNASYGFKAACVSACSRFCQQDHGYSGGGIVEWSGATANCLCSP